MALTSTAHTSTAHTRIARVPTASASRHPRQLCKHWGHNLKVEFSAESGAVTFARTARSADWPDDATLHLTADAGALTCRLDASAEGQLLAPKGAVEGHLERFAFRKGALGFEWRDEWVKATRHRAPRNLLFSRSHSNWQPEPSFSLAFRLPTGCYASLPELPRSVSPRPGFGIRSTR